jgi:integrase
MKPLGRHPERALTPVQVRNLSAPGRYADGGGLYLVVDPSGAKRWLLRTVIKRRRRDIGLGSASLVALAEAREAAREIRKQARAGADPLEDRRLARVTIPSFEEAARQVHTQHRPTWRNGKHAGQWLATLEQYVFPAFGSRPVDQVSGADVLKALTPIWLQKPETARRVKQRIGTVLDWAKAAGLRTSENPVSTIAKALPRQTRRPEHHRALPYDDVPAFVQRLRTGPGAEPVKLALELLVLTAVRTSELVNARWDEFDLEARLWIVPANRMKAGREHRVPLSPRAGEILERARVLAAGSPYVFPGRSGRKPLSNMAFLMMLRRMGEDATAHGFRSAFRDWAAERTNFAREVCELALAHAIPDRVEAAYRRGDLLEKRRMLMEQWAAFATPE